MSYATAYQRWVGVGPYYAMFPISFADEVVQTYAASGQRILDPFAGRASSVFAGAATGRPSIGIEINPVGWIYGKVKLQPAAAPELQSRVEQIARSACDFPANVDGELADFFKLCYAEHTLQFLNACRALLDWRQDKVDRTLMALILVDLHGRRDKSFSNQMSQSKAMSPEYSVRWWRERHLLPPEIEPTKFLAKKISWRYAKGIPETIDSDVILGDSCEVMLRIRKTTLRKNSSAFSLLFTSPPYVGITDYHRDQWLRLWMLGERPSPMRRSDRFKSAFASRENYTDLLNTVFSLAADVMSSSGCVYVRIDARPATFDVTRNVLRQVFPHWREEIREQPNEHPTQTALLGDKSRKPGERDIILKGSGKRIFACRPNKRA